MQIIKNLLFGIKLKHVLKALELNELTYQQLEFVRTGNKFYYPKDRQQGKTVANVVRNIMTYNAYVETDPDDPCPCLKLSQRCFTRNNDQYVRETLCGNRMHNFHVRNFYDKKKEWDYYRNHNLICILFRF